MKLLLIMSLLFTAAQDTFIGVAENPHYITNGTNEGYYIEEDYNIHKGDTVAIVNGEVYITGCSH